MRTSPRKGKVARWFFVDGRAHDHYLTDLQPGSAGWEADIARALTFSWPDACLLAREMGGLPLICAEENEDLVCSIPGEVVFAREEARGLA